MNVPKKTLALVLGSAFAATVATAPASAAENPFALKPLASGYMVADNHEGGEKMKDGKCSTGKCGASKKKMTKEKAAAEAKMKDGNCSAEMKDKAESKAREGNCGGEKK